MQEELGKLTVHNYKLEQENNFLRDHADHKVSSISYSGIGSLEKALVIFDVGKPFDGNRQNNNFNQKKSS